MTTELQTRKLAQLTTHANLTDAAYSKLISALFPGRTRWTLSLAQKQHPLIVEAFKAKVRDDDRLLSYMRELGISQDANNLIRVYNIAEIV